MADVRLLTTLGVLDDFVAGATREALMEVLAETPSADAVMEDGDDGTIVLSSASSVPGGNVVMPC